MKRSDAGKRDRRAGCRRKLLGLLPALLVGGVGLRCVDSEGGGLIDRTCGSLDQRLRDCDVLTGGSTDLCEGAYWIAGDRAESGEVACQYSCYADAECGAATASICKRLIGYTDLARLELSQCFVACARQYGLSCATPDPTLGAVPSFALCDGKSDCSDGSDESDCTSFDCGDGQVILQSQRCDGGFQCKNRRDEERNCFSFTCSEGGLLPPELRCDGAADCRDGSDERACPKDEPLNLDCTGVTFF